MLEMYEMLEIAEKIRKKNYYKILAQNLKKYRLKFYNEYRLLHKNIDNPYSSENIAHILSISRRHYNRLENPNYTDKNISIEKLLILCGIYGVTLESFFNSEDKKELAGM